MIKKSDEINNEKKVGPVDVYDCMGSEELREYYRRTWELSPQEKAGIIRYARLSVQRKRELFGRLVPEADDKLKGQLSAACGVIEASLEQLYSPKGRVLYVMERKLPKEGLLMEDRTRLILNDGLNYMKCTDIVTEEVLFADTIDEVFTQVNEYICWDIQGSGIPHHELFYVYQIPVSDRRRSDPLVEFYIMETGGKAEITDLYIEPKRCGEMGTDKPAYDIYSHGFEYAFHQNIVLPYETGDILRVKTPVMDAPAYGYFTKEFAYGWYNYLYASREAALSSDRIKNISFLSLSELFPEFHPYFMFDCLEKADGSEGIAGDILK